MARQRAALAAPPPLSPPHPNLSLISFSAIRQDGTCLQACGWARGACQKELMTLGPKKCEFRGGTVPPRVLKKLDQRDERVNNSSEVVRYHVRLLLSRATSRSSGITVRQRLMSTNCFGSVHSRGVLSISHRSAACFPPSPFSAEHRRTFKFLVKQPQLKCRSAFISKGNIWNTR